jgi:hypothetical protein
MLASLIGERVAQFLAATAGLSGNDRIATPWYGPDVSLSVSTVTAVLAAEQLVHGWDVAKSAGRPWPITVPEAHLVIRAVSSLLPLAANPETTARTRATYGVTVGRGGPRFTVVVDNGTVSVHSGIARRVDCRISADPVAFMLVAYGRVSQWGPIAKGRLRAWGRRPWLAFRFANLFFNP